ncbi:hypothetical protein ENKO_41690 [Enterobacter kobei]|jgi:hypothetical protein|uniref:Uncharacterized protein n=1 Tax=Enterobacter kobei TaxID=208224 RepID=A0AA86IUX0_9ENTR|nr:hypothetical protein ENKO_41690 [Enterobacter kobei]
MHPDLKTGGLVYTLEEQDADQFACAGYFLYDSPPLMCFDHVKENVTTLNIAWCLALGLEERRGLKLRFLP